MIELVIYPREDDDGLPGLRGWYRVERDGVEIVALTREPLLEGSRALLAAGVSPGEEVRVLRRVGSRGIALSSRVGVAAGLTVKEDGGGPRFVPVRDGPQCRPDGSPVAQSKLGATPIHKTSRTRPARSRPKIAGIVRDDVYPRMWRVRYVDGTTSGMVNFTRAKEAMRAAGKPVLADRSALVYADGYWGV